MITGLYSIKDNKAGALVPGVYPFMKDELAQRAFSSPSNLRSLSPQIVENCDDFDLVKLGTLNDETGEIVSKVEHVASFHDLVAISLRAVKAV